MTRWIVAGAVLLFAAPASAEDGYRVKLETGVAVPMRDGVVLRADVLHPEAPGRFPALVYRTPYGKEREWRDDGFALRAVRAGYVVVSQDVRGRYASEGVFDPYRQEGKDGYDTVEWVASLPYVDGNVGMTGLSYPGAVQWLAAMEQPPHLKAIAPSMCFSTGRRFFYFGGTWDLSWMSWFYLNIAPDVRAKLGIAGPTTAAQADAAWAHHKDEWLRFLPRDELPALADAAPSYYEWLAHPDDGPFWDFAEVRAHYGEIAIPALNLSGWHDEGYGPMGATENFRGTRANGSRLVIGPWTHGTPRLTRTREGELDFGVNAGLDYQALLLRWFDFWLKGAQNGLDAEPPVSIFVMGENVWREEAEWPLERARDTSFYLRASGGLGPEPPEGDVPPSRYDYDPLHPAVDRNGGVQGPYDQSALDARRDVLVFETEPLTADLEVTGPIEAELFVASSAPDTDFVVRLLDVYPDGRAYNLMSPTVEVVRARYRNGEARPEMLKPGEVVRLRFDNLITSNLFRAGHRLRVQVTSSLFPHFDPNLNTGESVARGKTAVTAHQEVHHSARYPSRLVVPVVPRQP